MTDDEKRESATHSDAEEKRPPEAEIEDLEVGPDDAERVAGGSSALPSEHAI